MKVQMQNDKATAKEQEFFNHGIHRIHGKQDFFSSAYSVCSVVENKVSTHNLSLIICHRRYGREAQGDSAMRKATLGKIAPNITSGSRGWASFYSDEGALFLRMTNLPKSGIGLLLHDNKYVKLPVGSSEGTRTRVQVNDILISITAELGKIGFVNRDLGEAYVNQHVALVRIEDQTVNPRYLAYYLASQPERNRLNRLNDSGAKAGLSLQTINRFPIQLPPLPEQKAIADLLSTWDEAIEKSERLIQAKEKRFKRLLNDLIHQGRSNHTWKGFDLGDLCIPVSRKNSENNLNVLTSSAQNGLVSQLEYYSKSVSAENVTGYYLLKKGEFAYNRSSAKGYPYGATKRLDRYEKGALSTLYLCFALKPDAPCEPDFLLHLFESGAVNRELRAVCQEGARSHGLLNITKSDFFGIKLFLPSREQQKEIQSALNTAQQEIELLKQLAEKYKTQKRGLMQKMLTGEWRIKPENVKQYVEG
jgi:type I restriction enzyme, S subunit